MTEFPLSSVLVVNYVVQDGKSNWLEGFVLMSEFIKCLLDHLSHSGFQCFILFLRPHSGFTLVRCVNPSLNSN